MGRAKIEIHLRDTENGGTEIKIGGDFTDGKSVSWDALQGRHKLGLLENGAEKLTYRTIAIMMEQLHKHALPLIAPPPKVWVPPVKGKQ